MLRITDPAQLEGLPQHLREQLGEAFEESAAVGDELLERSRDRNRQPEQAAGRELVKWIDSIVMPDGTRPGEYFAHVANAGIAQGRVRGGIFQGQGVRRGWPDYILDLPLGGYHGFRLELKAPGGGKPDPEQLEILARLERVGFKCAVAWGFDEAREATAAYLRLGGLE